MLASLANRKCPDCGNPLQRIIYGMVDSAVAADPSVIIGGCDINGTEPYLGCRHCGFQGFPGGRTYKTFHTKPGYKPGTENSPNPEVITREFNLLTASLEQLWAWSDGLFEARLELMHRGLSKEELEEAYRINEHWDFMPLEPVEKILCYYSRPEERVLGVGIFFADQKMQAALHLSPNSSKWRALASPGEFVDTLRKHKSEGLETWEFVSDNLDSGDAYWEGESSLGSEFLTECVERGWKVDPGLFIHELAQLNRPILWPHWLDYSKIGQL
jgi:hypothetical protein